MIAFMPAAIDACALYRMFIPHCNIPDSKFIFRLGPVDINELSGCSVAVVQRLVSDQNVHAMNRMKAAGLKVIYDLDDDIWNLPSWNPAQATFSRLIDGFKKCASIADVLTVSTKGLENAVKKGFSLDKPVYIVPNAIDFNLFRAKQMERTDEVMIGWGGSNTHSEDVAEAFDAVADVLDTEPMARMEIVGAPAIDVVVKWEDKLDAKGHRYKSKTTSHQASRIAMHSRSHFRPWVPVGEFPNRLASWGWDIALAPLAEHTFNRSKSCIKMLEAAALKIPCLVSNVQPYHEFSSLGGPDLKWLLCTLRGQWKDKLKVLINKPERRAELGQMMYDVAFKYFNAASIGQHWTYVAQQALKCS